MGNALPTSPSEHAGERQPSHGLRKRPRHGRETCSSRRRVLTTASVSAKRALSLLFIAMAAASQSCTTPGSVASSNPPAGTSQAAIGSTGFLPPRCEQRVDDLYRTLVASTIEELGTRYVLTVSCDGTHSIYLKPSQAIDFAKLLGWPICPRYRYVDQLRPRMPCLRPPCPETERVLDIVEVRPATSPQAGCGTP